MLHLPHLLLLALAASTATVTASPLDPHLPSFSQTWTEGWYLRVVTDPRKSDRGSPPSMGLTFGYTPRGHKRNVNSEVQLLLEREGKRHIRVYRDTRQNFNVTAHGRSIFEDPRDESDPDFEVTSEDFRAVFNKEECSVEAEVDGWRVEITCEGPPEPYGPNEESPEGHFASLPTSVVGNHWHVNSMATRVKYRIQDLGRKSEDEEESKCMEESDEERKRCVWKGCGWMHVEKNWGERFPKAWAWAEGISAKKHKKEEEKETSGRGHDDGTLRSAFTIAGGVPPSPFLPPGVGPNVWLLGVHSERLSWRLHPWDPTVFKVLAHPCGAWGDPSPYATLRVSAVQVAYGREVEIFVKAPVSSFAALETPGEKGFSAESMHSYSGTAQVRLYTWAPGDIGHPRRTLIYSETFDDVALEFGGEWRCCDNAEKKDKELGLNIGGEATTF